MKKSKTNQIVPVSNGATQSPSTRAFGATEVLVDAIYHVPEVAPKIPGPWSNEAEKIAWFDRATGYGCIIRRAVFGAHLEGFVGISPQHPLFGFDAAACRSMGIRVHGGINYAKECEKHEPSKTPRARLEERSVCHIVRIELPPIRHPSKAERTVFETKPHDDLWWFGFSCNLPADLIPDPNFRPVDQDPDAPEPIYRSEAYVFDQCLWLAEQLKAVEEGRNLATVRSRCIPPAGLNPFGETY